MQAIVLPEVLMGDTTNTHFSLLAPAVSLLLLTVVGCSTGETEPSPTDVSGVYQVVSVSEDATCTPASAFDLLRPAGLRGGTYKFTVRIDDLGDQVRMTLLAVEGGSFDPNSPPTVAELGRDGSVRSELQRPVVEQIVLQGRTFYQAVVEAVATGAFDREAHPITLTLTGSGTFVFREGSADAPIFATCSQSGRDSATRTGD